MKILIVKLQSGIKEIKEENVQNSDTPDFDFEDIVSEIYV